jgi:hypothetical protein
MTYRYDNGKPMSDNLIHAILFTGKVGFLSKPIWREFFGTGNERWQEKQIQHAIETGFFQKHRNELAKGYWILGDKGIELLREMGGVYVKPVQVNYLNHDQVVAQSILRLRQARIIRTFQVERELKSYGTKEFLLSDQDHDKKYPDAVFRIEVLGEKRTVAIEYERNRKSSSRYKSILFQYASITNLSMVLYIVEEEVTKKAIQGAMKHLGQTALLSKLAFVDAEEWRTSPLTALIWLPRQKVKLGEICTRLAA